MKTCPCGIAAVDCEYHKPAQRLDYDPKSLLMAVATDVARQAFDDFIRRVESWPRVLYITSADIRSITVKCSVSVEPKS